MKWATLAFLAIGKKQYKCYFTISIELNKCRLANQIKQNPKVFILCGGRRTGTTLLAGILSSSEKANPLGQEAQILTRMVETYRWGDDHFQDFGLTFFGDPQTYRKFFQNTVDRFTDDISARISPGGVLILKNPEFSKVLHSVDELFPNAQLLAMVRDPRDQVAAELEVRTKRVAIGMASRKEKMLNMVGLRNVVGLANQYNDYNKEILEIHNRDQSRVKIIRYEDLVQNPDATLIELEAATNLKLTFNPNNTWPSMSKHSGINIVSPSSSPLYGKPISTTSIGRYKRDLYKLEIKWIEKRCQELINQFGY